MRRCVPPKPPATIFPVWLADFLAASVVRKPSPHTPEAYRQDFEAIAAWMAGSADAVADRRVDELSKDRLRSEFATYTDIHSAVSIRRCWPTWNTVCTFHFTAELLHWRAAGSAQACATFVADSADRRPQPLSGIDFRTNLFRPSTFRQVDGYSLVVQHSDKVAQFSGRSKESADFSGVSSSHES